MSKIATKKDIILIVGASRGIGFQLTKQLISAGYIVCATVRKERDYFRLLKIKKKNNNFYVYKLDISCENSVNTCIEEIHSIHKKIDVLVNCTGQLLFGPIETASINQLKMQYDINIFGTIRLIHAIVPYMRLQKAGHIIFLGSTSGINYLPMYPAYASTKSALEAIAFSLASNLYPWNIKVSIIENSATKTKLISKSLIKGNRFKRKANPYKKYMENSLQFLKEIWKSGQDPVVVAKCIQKSIENPDSRFRKFTNKYTESVFKKTLKDPYADYWIQVAKEESKWLN